MTFLVVPSSRLRSWTWSSWMRTVLSTMPSFAPAIRSVKKRCHSASEKVMPLSALELVAQVGDELALAGDGEVLVGLLLQLSARSAFSRPASDWYAVSLAGPGTNSATTVLSAEFGLEQTR
jgi:hypothetical protein